MCVTIAAWVAGTGLPISLALRRKRALAAWAAGGWILGAVVGGVPGGLALADLRMHGGAASAGMGLEVLAGAGALGMLLFGVGIGGLIGAVAGAVVGVVSGVLGQRRESQAGPYGR